MSQVFSITGLNCQSCVTHVTAALSGLEGVHAVVVDLEPKGASKVHVEASRALSGDEVQEALAEEGDYSLLR